jgi:valyl-tRNA synthetase
VFESALQLLSPFMPFITEEIWHALYENHPPAKSIALTRYPQAQPDLLDAAAEQEMERLQQLIIAVRDLRRQLGVEEKAAVPILLRVAPAERAGIEQNQDIIGRLAKVSGIEFVDAMPEGAGVRSAPGFDVAVVYERAIDVGVECERLRKELARFEKEISNADRQLSNEGFLAKAPANVIEGLRRRADELGGLIPKTRAALESLSCGS